MAMYVYTAWFRDTAAHPDDQDYEWPACLFILADTPEDALRWGDVIAKDRARRKTREPFLYSYVDPPRPEDEADPRLRFAVGVHPTDQEIGW